MGLDSADLEGSLDRDRLAVRLEGRGKVEDPRVEAGQVDTAETAVLGEPGGVDLGGFDASSFSLGPAAGLSGADAIEWIMKAGPLEISWGGGETTSLGIELESVGSACASPTDGSIQLDTMATLTSGVGRWKGALPMRLLAEAADCRCHHPRPKGQVIDYHSRWSQRGEGRIRRVEGCAA